MLRKIIPSLVLIIILLGSYVPLGFSKPNTTRNYSVQDIGSLANTWSRASDINDLGQVVGVSGGSDAYNHAFLWSKNRGMIDIGTLPEGTDTWGQAINNLGHVTGIATISGNYHAYFWTSKNGMKDLGIPEGYTSISPYAINDYDQIVGAFYNNYAEQHAFIWTPIGGFLDLSLIGGFTDSQALDINNVGQVVGYSNLGPFIWSESSGMVLLNGQSYIDGIAWGINDLGQVVGQTGAHAFLWTVKNGFTDLGILPGFTYSYAHEINNAGQIVGTCYDNSFSYYHGFVWTQSSGMVDLGTMSGGTFSMADAGINARGQIVGFGDTSTGAYRAILWIK